MAKTKQIKLSDDDKVAACMVVDNEKNPDRIGFIADDEEIDEMWLILGRKVTIKMSPSKFREILQTMQKHFITK